MSYEQLTLFEILKSVSFLSKMIGYHREIDLKYTPLLWQIFKTWNKYHATLFCACGSHETVLIIPIKNCKLKVHTPFQSCGRNIMSSHGLNTASVCEKCQSVIQLYIAEHGDILCCYHELHIYGQLPVIVTKLCTP